jgi:hypothetical protein
VNIKNPSFLKPNLEFGNVLIKISVLFISFSKPPVASGAISNESIFSPVLS